MKNELENKNSALNDEMINIIIAFAGLILTFLSMWLISISDILLGIGCSLIASALVSYLNSRYRLRNETEKMVTEKWGLCALYATRQEMNKSCANELHKNRKNLDMIGFGFRSLRDSQTPLLKSKVKNGMSLVTRIPYFLISVILMNTNSQVIQRLPFCSS